MRKFLVCLGLVVSTPAFAQNGNIADVLGEVLGQVGRGGGLGGIGQMTPPIDLTPAGVNPIGSVSMEFYFTPDTKKSGKCIPGVQIKNNTSYVVDLGYSFPWHYVNQDGRVNRIKTRMSPLGPGQYTDIKFVSGVWTNTKCEVVSRYVLTGGSPKEWPNYCLVGGRSASPCPITVKASGVDIPVEWR